MRGVPHLGRMARGGPHLGRVHGGVRGPLFGIKNNLDRLHSSVLKSPYPHQKTLLNGINELGVGLNHLGRVGWYMIEA